MISEYTYVGDELPLFAAVNNWKLYWSSSVRLYIKGNVLEVGAGIGANTLYIDVGERRDWVCLEPDVAMAEQLRANLANITQDKPYEIVCGTLNGMGGRVFDTILYIDVLEHIDNDVAELALASRHLSVGGHLIVLAPAHQALYSAFDAALGHFRRYNANSLRAIAPPDVFLKRVFYLDSIGFFLSAGNRFFLRQSSPTRAQLAFWDQWIVPVSKFVDRLVLHRFGKTIVAVWEKQ